jgi:hypothetical protein
MIYETKMADGHDTRECSGLPRHSGDRMPVGDSELPVSVSIWRASSPSEVNILRTKTHRTAATAIDAVRA